MYKIQTLNKISKIGLDVFTQNYEISDTNENADAILVRSASMHDMPLSENLLAIARAGAGVNNIPVDSCSEKGIVVFNTPGANANAVKELVLAGLLLSSRKVISSIEWATTLKGKGAEVGKLVEKGKGAFTGPEIKGKTLGVVGLGAIGILVANAAISLGMKVYGYDPFLSVDAAWGLSSDIKHALSLDEIYANSDYITVHVPLNPSTKEMINSDAIAKMKDGVRILNFSRDALVSTPDIITALESKKVSAYVVDFPTDEVIGVEGIIAIPHLGASTPESEDNCAIMAASEVMDYLENGNITNSVNFPNISMSRSTDSRIVVIHKNITNVISKLSGGIAETGANIENMESKSKKDYAVSMFDISNGVSSETIDKLKQVEGVIQVRVIG